MSPETTKEHLKVTLYCMPEGVSCIPCDLAEEALGELKKEGWDIEIKKVLQSATNPKYNHGPVLEIQSECGCTTVHGFTGKDNIIERMTGITCNVISKKQEKSDNE